MATNINDKSSLNVYLYGVYMLYTGPLQGVFKGYYLKQALK